MILANEEVRPSSVGSIISLAFDSHHSIARSATQQGPKQNLEAKEIHLLQRASKLLIEVDLGILNR